MALTIFIICCLVAFAILGFLGSPKPFSELSTGWKVIRFFALVIIVSLVSYLIFHVIISSLAPFGEVIFFTIFIIVITLI